jgi:hypothetical protein
MMGVMLTADGMPSRTIAMGSNDDFMHFGWGATIKC